MSVSVTDVVAALEGAVFTANTEVSLQDGIRDLLALNFPGEFVREFTGFGRRDRPDFYCESSGIALEVKISTSAGTGPKVFSQLQRYAEHKAVKHLVFASPSRRIASIIGDVIGGKPVARAVLHLGY